MIGSLKILTYNRLYFFTKINPLDIDSVSKINCYAMSIYEYIWDDVNVFVLRTSDHKCRLLFAIILMPVVSAIAVCSSKFPEKCGRIVDYSNLVKNVSLKFGVNGRFPGSASIITSDGLRRTTRWSTAAAVERLVFYNPFRLIFHSGSNFGRKCVEMQHIYRT